MLADLSIDSKSLIRIKYHQEGSLINFNFFFIANNSNRLSKSLPEPYKSSPFKSV